MLGLLQNITFVSPVFFVLLLLLPIMAWWYFRNYRQRYAPIQMSTLAGLENTQSIRGRLRSLLPILRVLSLVALIVALARPQQVLKEEEVVAEGIDISLVMDLSSSMLAQDFQPNRLDVSKRVAADFVRQRQYDRIGLVVFAGEAFTQCPLTTDHLVLNEFLSKLECGILEDGTAIGMGLATAVNRLKDSESKSKVVILLTDGVNNAGYQSPMLAAKIAKEYNVKVYTIGIGSVGETRAPVSIRGDGKYILGTVKVEIDEELLRQIAEMTGGKYYRALDEQSLEQIYASIDQLEKMKIDVTSFKRYSEEYHHFAFGGILFLLIEVLLRYTVLRAIP
ncbi:MAG: VWA domain-containing protein [Saprospiraceae bacterium]|nr:VWA domain-containing protein [Saprospiraceae bacterium]